MKVFQLNDYSFRSNSYLLADDISGEAAIIDPSMPARMYSEIIDDSNLILKYIMITHNHFDHVLGYDELFKLYGVLGLMEQEEMACANDAKKNASFLIGSDFAIKSPIGVLDLKSSDYKLGENLIRCVKTPGHSIGSVSFICDKLLFSGDLLFSGSIGRTDLYGGNMDKLISSVEKLFRMLPENTVVYPGHGPITTILNEINNNPYL